MNKQTKIDLVWGMILCIGILVAAICSLLTRLWCCKTASAATARTPIRTALSACSRHAHTTWLDAFNGTIGAGAVLQRWRNRSNLNEKGPVCLGTVPGPVFGISFDAAPNRDHPTISCVSIPAPPLDRVLRCSSYRRSRHINNHCSTKPRHCRPLTTWWVARDIARTIPALSTVLTTRKRGKICLEKLKMLFYCPIDKEVCACKCCLVSGCGASDEREPVMFLCVSCHTLVSGAEFMATKCSDCALAEHVGVTG